MYKKAPDLISETSPPTKDWTFQRSPKPGAFLVLHASRGFLSAHA